MNRTIVMLGLIPLFITTLILNANATILSIPTARNPKAAIAASTASPCDYARPCQPLVKPAFTPLPIGDIEPTGWLRDWAEAAANGITGHLDEYSPTFADAWKGFSFKAPGAKPDGTGWPLEQCSYWLDGAVRLGYILHDEALIKKATARLDLVVNGVNNGGASFIYWETNSPEGFNSWACSQMGRALVAYYEATGEKRILNALDKAYCNYQVPGNLEMTNVNVSGLCNLDAMLETYSFTGDKRLLERVTSAMNRPDVRADINDWLAGKFNPCHTVCYYELIRIPALFYPWSGDQKYLEASLKAFHWVDTEDMLPYGVASGGEFLSGIGPFRLTETCDVQASLWSRIWMYRITGDRSWGDKLELEFFNAAAAPIARNFKTMCYYQSPNRIGSETLPIGHPLCPGPGCLRFTRLGDTNVLCCVGNMNRIIPNYIMHMWMATYDDGLAATLYGPCAVHALAGDHVPVKLNCQTDYPFKDSIHVQVTPAKEASFPLYFRIPGWCHKPRLAVDGEVIKSKPDEHGFVRIERTWKSGDTVTLKLPMSVRIDRGYADEYSAANREYYGYLPKAVFKKKWLPYESIYYGPLLFALPIPDVNPNEPEPDAQWQFALNNNPQKEGRDITVKQRTMPSHWNWPLKAPIVLKVSAKEFDWKPSMSQPLPAVPVKSPKWWQKKTITLVPYGCTKFRISMFPVTQKAWENPPPSKVAEAGQGWDE